MIRIEVLPRPQRPPNSRDVWAKAMPRTPYPWIPKIGPYTMGVGVARQFSLHYARRFRRVVLALMKSGIIRMTTFGTRLSWKDFQNLLALADEGKELNITTVFGKQVELPTDHDPSTPEIDAPPQAEEGDETKEAEGPEADETEPVDDESEESESSENDDDWEEVSSDDEPEPAVEVVEDVEETPEAAEEVVEEEEPAEAETEEEVEEEDEEEEEEVVVELPPISAINNMKKAEVVDLLSPLGGSEDMTKKELLDLAREALAS